MYTSEVKRVGTKAGVLVKSAAFTTLFSTWYVNKFWRASASAATALPTSVLRYLANASFDGARTVIFWAASRVLTSSGLFDMMVFKLDRPASEERTEERLAAEATMARAPKDNSLKSIVGREVQ